MANASLDIEIAASVAPATVVARPSDEHASISTRRKVLLLSIWCTAQFMDAMISSALFPAIPYMQVDLGMNTTETIWIFAAYTAPFAACLLISGRISDVYSAKWSFVIGSALVALFSLGGGFAHDKVTMFVLRGFAGVGAALTVPSALALIVEWIPDPHQQAQAIAMFGGFGSLGNVLGIILGAIWVEWVNWRWIFYFTAMLGAPIAVLGALLIPASPPRQHKPSWRRLDLGAVSLVTSGIILLIYAVTTGPATGWNSAQVIAPLILSILLLAAFFVLESRLDPHMASLPPSVWFYQNVPILLAVAFIPFGWWSALYYELMPYYQDVWGLSPIMTGVRFIPTGITSAFVALFAGKLPRYVDPRWTIMCCLMLIMVGTVLLPFGDRPSRYWGFHFTAYVIGTLGNATMVANATAAIFANTPVEMAGIIGAIFNCALQIGQVLILAAITSITTSLDTRETTQGRPAGYHGIAASFWFELGIVSAVFVAVVMLYRSRTPATGTLAEAHDEKMSVHP